MDFSSFREAPKHNSFVNGLHEFELKNGTRTGEEIMSDNPAELGIATGLLAMACIFNLKVNVLKDDFFKEPLHMDSLRLKVMLNFVLNFVCFCVFSPFIFSSLVLLYAYRCAITLALRIQLREKFGGLLEGADSVWAVEDASCKSVINVFTMLEAAPNVSNADLLLQLRELALQKLLGRDARLAKLSSLRKKRFGYFYWERSDSVDVTEHVRWLDSIDNETSCTEKSNDKSDLKKILSRVCTQPLPQNDQASWEILIMKNQLQGNFDPFRDLEEGLVFHDRTNVSKNTVGIPMIFRIHHTVGDGFALFKLLLTTIADSRAIEVTLENKQTGISSVAELGGKTNRGELANPKFFGSNAELLLRKNKDLLGASMPFSLIINANLKETVEKYIAVKLGKFVSFREFGETIFEFGVSKIKEAAVSLAKITILKLNDSARLVLVLIGMPSCLVNQALRSMDNSALHGPKLSGKKMISFWIEGDSGKNFGDRNLLTTIQEMKNATGTRFGDVIMAALSASLHKYFKEIGEFAPKSLTVVLPSRMIIPDENLRMDNGFSVGLLPLCISGSTEDQSTPIDGNKKELTLMQRLFDVARCSHNLRSRSDYLVNFWVIKWLSAVLPEVLLRPLLKSNSTLVFSNVPGPQEVKILGQKLINLVFWVPHRGTTGIGFSVLSYGGNVHLGLVVDKTLIRNENQLTRILENTVQEIYKLHEIIFMSHFSKSLHNSTTASTDTESECCK